MSALDPWLDAAALAQRLLDAETELLIVLGAEGWCSKCQRLRPAFAALAADMPEYLLPMWLDLEDHAEFLDGFVPPDLPLLLRWRRGNCVQAAVIEDIAVDGLPHERVKLRPLVLEGSRLQHPLQGGWVELPPLWRELVSDSWASAG